MKYPCLKFYTFLTDQSQELVLQDQLVRLWNRSLDMVRNLDMFLESRLLNISEMNLEISLAQAELGKPVIDSV